MTEKEKLWICTFEYKGIAKVGGLGEVPAHQAKYLKDFFDITIFIPSHGQFEHLSQESDWEKLPFNCIGQVDLSPFGIEHHENSYVISFYQGYLADIRVILFCGDNQFTKKYLDDIIVYNPETFSGKLCLFSLGMKCIIEYFLDKAPERLPNIVHMHDYHVIIPFIALKQRLFKQGIDVASVFTIHLLTWPRLSLPFYYLCGVEKDPIRLTLPEGNKLFTLEEIFNLCTQRGMNQEGQPPTVEQIGALINDQILTVSESYLISDVIPHLGRNLIEFKSDYTWNGCDWEYDKIYEEELNNYESEIRKVLNKEKNTQLSQQDLKEYLLTYKIGNLKESPIIKSEKISEVLGEIAKENPYLEENNVLPFSKSGPLMITAGRISAQKGYETIFEAIPQVIREIPNAKFLFLMLPTDYSLQEIKMYANYMMKYPNNVRIIFGQIPEIFRLAHLAADVYAALSRWEPFGIIALEAMSLKIPVIATKVGGLQESVIDARIDPQNGTGFLVEKDNPNEFSIALISLFKMLDIQKEVKKGKSVYDIEVMQIVNQIPDPIVKAKILVNPSYLSEIRENCYRRVENHFRWDNVSKKLIKIYENTKQIRNGKIDFDKLG